MPLLYDANGRQVYEGGFTHEDVQAAIEAAHVARDFQLAQELGDRYGWNVCPLCAKGKPRGREIGRQANGLFLFVAEGRGNGYVYSKQDDGEERHHQTCDSCTRALDKGVGATALISKAFYEDLYFEKEDYE